MVEDSCCTCAKLLSRTTAPPPEDEKKTEKRMSQAARDLECCGRKICSDCINSNPRFATYCPFCQVSSASTTSLLPQGLRDPPAYSPPTTPPLPDQDQDQPPPPPYSSSISSLDSSGTTTKAKDVLHFIDPSQDTLSSLSLRYQVPIDALRRTNNLYSDHLLAARRTILIPGEFYKAGVSLSPRPIDGEEEELRKAKIRRWMVACKVAEYELALIYLKQSHYDLEKAIAAYMEDERWESEHPLKSSGGNKGKTALRSQGTPRWRAGVI